MQAPTVVVAGSVAQRPFVGGHTWVFLNYLLGFRQLGWNVHLVDRLEPAMCVDRHGRPAAFRESANLAYLTDVLDRFGLGDCWTVGYDGWRETAGASREQTLAVLGRSEFVLNVMGFLDDPELLGAAPCRVFLDIDPGFGQMWRALGLDDIFDGHDRFVTVGENVGREGCRVPTVGLDWITTKQPVVLDQWDPTEPAGRAYTSVVTWRGPFAPVEYEGTTYGLRAHEMRRFADLPRLTGCRFEVALAIDAADAADQHRLERAGWRLTDPGRVVPDPWAYRAFVQSSRAELMIAKQMYVATRSGWFSDRSACYLAAGRPVVAQDTGLADHLPVGAGLVTFTDLDEAAEAVREVERDWGRHAAAARAVAEECFAAPRVLGRLVDALGVV
jgi:hypothetical protein